MIAVGLRGYGTRSGGYGVGYGVWGTRSRGYGVACVIVAWRWGKRFGSYDTSVWCEIP